MRVSDIWVVPRPAQVVSAYIFVFWLTRQADRDDPVGDLARDFINDVRRPRFDNIEHLRVHIYSGSCHEAQQALAEAIREFRWITREVAA